jgi:hypothetical protein
VGAQQLLTVNCQDHFLSSQVTNEACGYCDPDIIVMKMNGRFVHCQKEPERCNFAQSNRLYVSLGNLLSEPIIHLLGNTSRQSRIQKTI